MVSLLDCSCAATLHCLSVWRNWTRQFSKHFRQLIVEPAVMNWCLFEMLNSCCCRYCVDELNAGEESWLILTFVVSSCDVWTNITLRCVCIFFVWFLLRYTIQPKCNMHIFKDFHHKTKEKRRKKTAHESRFCANSFCGCCCRLALDIALWVVQCRHRWWCWLYYASGLAYLVSIRANWGNFSLFEYHYYLFFFPIWEWPPAMRGLRSLHRDIRKQ